MEWEMDRTSSKSWKVLHLIGKEKRKEKEEGSHFHWICLCLPIPFTLVRTTNPLLSPKPWVSKILKVKNCFYLR